MILRRRFLNLAAVTLVLAAAFPFLLPQQGALSQTKRTIKIIVPFGPGSSIDVLARVLAEQIGRTKGLATVVENHPGAGAIVATELVARAEPDGNTVLINSNPFIINPLIRKVNYDPLTGFEPICHLVNVPAVIAVNSASPYRTLVDLFNAAHVKPGELTLASVGPGTAIQIAFEMLKRAANVNMTFISYPGSPPAINALLGNQQLNAGTVRALAVASPSRIEPLPDVPTLSEAGYHGNETAIWNGVVAPAKTPKDTVAQLVSLFTTALLKTEAKQKLVALGLFPSGICGADFGAFLRKQYDEYGRAIREANIKVE
jgi:tripartite-type tricarboxylate transporter receptor subunit TctC